eukprot:5484664-Alexandrium_andersonii.AAC.1
MCIRDRSPAAGGCEPDAPQSAEQPSPRPELREHRHTPEGQGLRGAACSQNARRPWHQLGRPLRDQD